MKIIAGHWPGKDDEPVAPSEGWDACPECSGLKRVQSALCQDCYLQHHKHRRERDAQLRKNARAWALRLAAGEPLYFKPGPQMSFEQFWEALRGAAAAVRVKFSPPPEHEASE